MTEKYITDWRVLERAQRVSKTKGETEKNRVVFDEKSQRRSDNVGRSTSPRVHVGKGTHNLNEGIARNKKS